jgi:ABC-type Na+ transport system ATPase subunit NatA
MPESPGLFDGLYAHESLAFNARMFGLEESDVRRRVTDLLEAGESQPKSVVDEVRQCLQAKCRHRSLVTGS